MRSQRHTPQAGVSLIELLVSMSVMLVLTTMILLGWFALQKSYSYSTKSNVQRDDARGAMSRMQREIRDAEARPLPNTDPAIVRARAFWIEFSTTFNKAGNTAVDVVPRLVMYRLYKDGSVWRFEDTDGSGTITGVSLSPSPDDPDGWPLSEQTGGEGARLVLRNVVNFSQDPGNPTPLFLYTYYDDSGTLVTADHAYNAGTSMDRSNTIAVTIHVLDDLVPGKAPVAADLRVSAQLRNQR
jgi:prepilin-type N-terminal cleavage/methylation domain-containing protein